jgi:DNA polymerase I-like protein with 3'-5' exonuclease and polymerase domains
MKRFSLDTETTGLDLRHGARPFMVTMAYDNDKNLNWDWPVDPETRKVKPSRRDLIEIREVIYDEAEEIILQNPKFDVGMLVYLYRDARVKFRWPWEKTRDTLLASHLLCSDQRHDLTTITLIYLGVNVQPYEDEIKAATVACRRLAQGRKPKYPNWMISKAGLPCMPSIKGSNTKQKQKGAEDTGPWKSDMWLPKHVAGLLGKPEDDPYWYACEEYANSDSIVTLHLWEVLWEKIEERGLAEIYLERLKLLPIIYRMEDYGVTIAKSGLREKQEEYRKGSETAEKVCTNIAESYGYDLKLPKSGNNKSLIEFVFGEDNLNLEPHERSKKTKAPSLNSRCVEFYEDNLPDRSKSKVFIRRLAEKRKRDTALQAMEGYEKFWLKTGKSRVVNGVEEYEWYRLHPSLNITGTVTLRWSSSNPNEQSISRKKGFNIREAFGPAPGREWWSLDAKNIELRLPAYAANEPEMIALFEKPDEAPYFGSYHLLVFDILHPDKWDHSDPKGLVKAKDKYESTYYKWVKNGNFAVQYGALERSGTADKAYRIPGAQRRIQDRFSGLKALNEKMIAQAERHGFIETMPDRNVNPERGYPLMIGKGKWGKIRPTTPLNYYIQGSAMWWMMKAMIRCQEYLETTEAARQEDYAMIMQVHDELVFDFPRAPRGYRGEPHKFNLPVIREVKRLMELGGDDLGVPTPCSVDYHPDHWGASVGISI